MVDFGRHLGNGGRSAVRNVFRRRHGSARHRHRLRCGPARRFFYWVVALPHFDVAGFQALSDPRKPFRLITPLNAGAIMKRTVAQLAGWTLLRVVVYHLPLAIALVFGASGEAQFGAGVGLFLSLWAFFVVGYNQIYHG